MPQEFLDDEYVAELLKQDAKDRSKQFSSVGLRAFLPERSSEKAPKPNTRFLRNILRETDSHNAALKAKEESESRARLRALRTGRPSGLFSYSDALDQADDNPKPSKRRRVDDRGRRRESQERTGGYKSRRMSSDDGRIDRERRRTVHERSDSEDSAPERTKRRRRRSRSGSQEGIYHDHNRRHRRHSDNEDERHAAQSRRRSTEHEDKRRHHRHHRHHRHRSQSRRRRSRSREHRSRKRDREKSPSSSEDRIPSPDRLRHKRRDKGCAHRRSEAPKSLASQRQRSPHVEESRLLASDSDPLEAIIGPTAPPEAPPVRSKGRGAFKSSLSMDAHFAPGYDPSTDVRIDSEEEDEWGQATEAFRDRMRWRQQGAERLRAAGFTDDAIKKWEKGDEKTEEDVTWSKKGEGREWDRGKVLDDDGQITLQAEWGRLKGT